MAQFARGNSDANNEKNNNGEKNEEKYEENNGEKINRKNGGGNNGDFDNLDDKKATVVYAHLCTTLMMIKQL